MSPPPTLPRIPHHRPLLSRRDLLLQGGCGFGALALTYLLGRDRALASTTGPTPTPHHPPRAKNVIFLFMEGGPSHIDLFDPKPLLNQLAGQPLPDSFGTVITAMGEYGTPLMACKRTWKQHGQAGTWVSDWLPHTAQCVDDIAVIRSCWADGLNHSNGVCQMNTGSILGGRPSLGAWVSYGLGSENDDLPAFVVLEDDPGKVVNGPRNWGPGFMPATYQGTPIFADQEPIRNLSPPKGMDESRQRSKLALLNDLNRRHLETRREQSELDARIRSYELAFRMQATAPEAVDLNRETEETQQLYGIDQPATASFGRMCLLARRLVERGLRFVQLYHGSGSKWDAHSGLDKNHAGLCRGMDQPVAGLLRDLKRRGLLDETLVVWGGEFGRTPMSEKGDGRDHNPWGFTMWMAGGGVRGGQTIGATDELGLRAVEDRLHVHDLHATILHLLGLDHMQLTYLHKGRPERPTMNEGHPCRKLWEG
ncbi:MAG: DUF1501 domain-containing protein [Pirellulaceae bacterium]|nr:DUF1501 domain-containing protein [Pirellulaceae bacterium]